MTGVIDARAAPADDASTDPTGPRVALLHSNDEFAETLADLAEERSAYRVDNFSTVRPPRRRLPRFLAEHFDGNTGEYDLVQVDELLVNGPMGAAAATALGLPLVAYFRGWADHTNDHGALGRLTAARRHAQTALLLRAVDRTLFISERTRRAFDRDFDLPEPAVVPRPIDVEGYVDGTDPFADGIDPFDADAPRLLTTTNLAYRGKYRGVTTILDGLRDVFPDHPDLRYLVAGGGRYEDTLRSHVESYEFRDRVRVLGFREDVPDLLAGADAFVYVSFLDSFATTIPEAQAAGLPVVAGDRGGVPEAVGDAGLVVEPTADAIGDAVSSLLDDETLRAELSAASRERMARFNEECVDGFVAAWDAVLGR